MVSVIIPNYNHAPYLKQRIDIVLAQTYREFEVIILDDCSTDNSRDVIAGYKGHPQVSHVIFNERNSGSTFIQWQKGIELAKGKYIWIAESDDWCEPTLLQTLVEGLEAKPNAVLGYVQSSIVFGSNDIDQVSSSPSLFEYVAGREYVSDYLAKKNSIFNASMAVFKKDCYWHVPPSFTSFKFCGDWLFWNGIAQQGDVFISGKVLNYFRKHANDVTAKTLHTGGNFTEELQVLENLFAGHFINDRQYKVRLLEMYTGYVLNRKRFTAEMQKNINYAFVNAGGQNNKYFLFWRVNRFTIFILKVKRRLK